MKSHAKTEGDSIKQLCTSKSDKPGNISIEKLFKDMNVADFLTSFEEGRILSGENTKIRYDATENNKEIIDQCENINNFNLNLSKAVGLTWRLKERSKSCYYCSYTFFKL